MISSARYHAPKSHIRDYKPNEYGGHTISRERLLVPRLSVAEPIHPVVHSILTLVIKVLPSWMLQGAERVECGACARSTR